MEVSLSLQSDLEHVPGDWLGCTVPLVWPLPTSVVRVVCDTLLGVVLGMVWGEVDVCAGLVSLVPASTEDVEEIECPSPLDESLQSIAFGVCTCPDTKFGSCIVVVVLFVDVQPTGVRAIRLGGAWAVGLFSSALLCNWLFAAGMRGTRLGVIRLPSFTAGELLAFNCP